MADIKRFRTTEIAKEMGYSCFSTIPTFQALPRTDIINFNTRKGQDSSFNSDKIQLYIEGVNIPFISISINSSYGSIPEAMIEIPHSYGMTEICKGYFPKIEIFYDDTDVVQWAQTGVVDVSKSNGKDILCLLFSGNIVRSSYGKHKSTEGDSVSLRFSCLHKYYIMSEIILKFGARGFESITEDNSQVIAKPVEISSAHAKLLAITGVLPHSNSSSPVTKDNPNGSVNDLQSDLVPYYDRLKGMPGVAVALWNIFKRDCYNFANYAKMMENIYIPLFDSTLSFFKRFTGHGVIESQIERERTTTSNSPLTNKLIGFTTDDKNVSLLVAPAYRNFVNEAISVDLSVVMMMSGLGYKGEMQTLSSMFTGFFNSSKYDLEVLASPIQSSDFTLQAVDVIAKPTLPFYYAPKCNVLLPYLYSSLNIDDDSYAVPTRGYAENDPSNDVAGVYKMLEYRTPNDVRIATSYNGVTTNANLASSRIATGEYPAPHEYGRGVRSKNMQLDSWINYLYSSEASGFSISDNVQEAKNHEDDKRAIDPTKSLLVDKTGNGGGQGIYDPVNNPDGQMWKHWNDNIPLPYYFGPRTPPTKGFDMIAGQPGNQAGIHTAFRTSTVVPPWWNVVYFPSSNSYFAYPPHFDYVRGSFWVPQGHRIADYNRLTKTNTSTAPAAVAATPVDTSTPDQKALKAAWDKANPGFPKMNPYASKEVNGIDPFEATIYNFIDYDYSLSLVQTRTGSATGPFNPYPVVGYPIDIIDSSPHRPSVHAFLTNVSHNFTPTSADTSYSFVSVITYDELNAYKLPAVLPWFQYQLGMIDNLSLINPNADPNTPTVATITANNYYMSVLGVGYADPSILEDISTGTANSVYVNKKGDFSKDSANVFKDSNLTPTLGNLYSAYNNPNMTYSGNLALVRREIETMSDIEAFRGITYIRQGNIADLTIYISTTTETSPLYTQLLQLPGRSLFLDYSVEDAALRAVAKVAPVTTVTTNSKIPKRYEITFPNYFLKFLSNTSSATECFVHGKFSKTLQKFLLDYSISLGITSEVISDN